MTRGKRKNGKYITSYGAKHLFKYYKNTTDSKIAVNNGTFYKVIQDLNNGLMNSIILEGETVKLPCLLGSLRIKKSTKPNNINKKNLKIDWGKSLKYDKIIYHLNENRGGYYYRFYWRKKSNKLVETSNMALYAFIPLILRKQQLSIILNNNKEIDYLH